MMDALTALVLLGIGFCVVKKRLLPRLKKDRQGALPEVEDVAAMPDSKGPDFCILSFNTADFTRTDDLAHCVEYELGNTISGLKKENCRLTGDPFPVVIGSSLLIFLYYRSGKEQMEEVAG